MLKIVAILNIYLLPSQSLVPLKSVTDLGSIPKIVRLSVAYNLAEAGNKVNTSGAYHYSTMWISSIDLGMCQSYVDPPQTKY